MEKYTVIRDVQEKKNFFDFKPSQCCEGTITKSLKTGDYTIRGLENILCIERKATTGEIAGNLPTKRFTNELERMRSFKHAFIVLEFNMDDLYRFPYDSGIPPKYWRKLRVNSQYLLKRLVEIQIEYNVQIIFAGKHAGDIVNKIFKRMAALYEKDIA